MEPDLPRAFDMLHEITRLDPKPFRRLETDYATLKAASSISTGWWNGKPSAFQGCISAVNPDAW